MPPHSVDEFAQLYLPEGDLDVPFLLVHVIPLFLAALLESC